jgi:hypothetical protein
MTTQETKWPPYPKPATLTTDEEKEQLKYVGDKDDIPTRMMSKLIQVWFLWGELVKSEELHKALRNTPEQNTDEYMIKRLIINIIEMMAKILSNTDLVEEITKTSDNK